MKYIKILDSAGEVISVEAHESPAFVRWQARNRLAVHCSEVQAQGIVSADGSVIYQLEGRDALPIEGLKTAVIISQVDYEALIAEYTDPEDSAPTVGEESEDEPILTRAELTARVAELEHRNAFLEDCILEMSEIVYG